MVLPIALLNSLKDAACLLSVFAVAVLPLVAVLRASPLLNDDPSSSSPPKPRRPLLGGWRITITIGRIS
jgi:hypothetical protein